MAFSQERLALLKSVHDPLVVPGANPVGDQEATVVATGDAITKELEIERQILGYKRDVGNWALNDASLWALKLVRPPFPAAPAAIPAFGKDLPPLPHIQNPAYFGGMRAAVAQFVAADGRVSAMSIIDKLEKSS